MFTAIGKISAAVGRLVKSITALAATLEEVNEGVRETLRLDKSAQRARKVIGQETTPAAG
jgi:hypothetical protein